MLQTLKHSVLITLRQWKIVAMVYVFQLLLALTLGLQAYTVLEASIGKSLEINKLVANYDHTVISDFLKVHGASITPLIGQLRWLVLVYLLFAVFIDAGLLACAKDGKNASPQTFWQNGGRYFFPFLYIFLFFMVFALLWTALLFLPTLSYLQTALATFPNEKYVVWGVISLLIVYIVGLFLLLAWSILSRNHRLQMPISAWASLKSGWKTLMQRKSYYFRLLLLFLCMHATLIFLYWGLEAMLGMTSAFLIVFMAVIQQVFTFLRIMLRQSTYLAFLAT